LEQQRDMVMFDCQYFTVGLPGIHSQTSYSQDAKILQTIKGWTGSFGYDLYDQTVSGMLYCSLEPVLVQARLRCRAFTRS
jgi:hypothetical protein